MYPPFELNCASKRSDLGRDQRKHNPPKSAPLPRKKYKNVDNFHGNDPPGNSGQKNRNHGQRKGSLAQHTKQDSVPTNYSYMQFASPTNVVPRGRSPFTKRKLYFDYVPWSVLER